MPTWTCAIAGESISTRPTVDWPIEGPMYTVLTWGIGRNDIPDNIPDESCTAARQLPGGFFYIWEKVSPLSKVSLYTTIKRKKLTAIR